MFWNIAVKGHPYIHAINALKETFHNSLKTRFWRGLGIGLIIYSRNLIENERPPGHRRVIMEGI